MTKLDPELEREEWVMIGHLSYDGDAEIVSSLFESHGIPVLIQGRNHRRMLGFIGGHIHLRVLVPKMVSYLAWLNPKIAVKFKSV